MVERREREHDALPKRYAESRVRAELRRDRQREMELRSCGVVRSISDRPTGHQREVIDVFSSETPLTSKRRPASAAARRSADGFVAVDRHAQPYKHAAIKVDKDASAEATDIADRRSPVVPSVLRTYEYPSYPERQNSVTNDTLVTSTLVSPRHASNRRSLSTENERLSSGLSSLITSLLVEVWNTVISVSVCLFVCLLAYLRNHSAKFHQIFYTGYPLAWLVCILFARCANVRQYTK